MPERRVLLGHISQANGLRGAVLIKSHTANPEDIAAYGTLTDKDGQQSFDLRVIRTTNKGVIVKIAGIEDRTAAENLRGTELYVDRDQLPEAEDDAYYHNDLVGLTAISSDGGVIGDVVAVQNYGASDLLEIKPKTSKTTELIPFTKEFVPEVDVNAGRLTIVLPTLTEARESDEQNSENDS